MARQISDRPSLGLAAVKQCGSTAFLVLLIVSIAAQSSAQQSSQQAYDIPVVLSRIDTREYVSYYDDGSSNLRNPALPPEPAHTTYGTYDERNLVQDFSADNFQVRVGGMPGDLQSLSVDKGPKRIYFTLDASSRVSNQQWEAELKGVARILLYARSIDRYAFVLVGASPATSGFVSPGEAKERLKSLQNTRPAPAGPEAAIYDGLLTAAKTLDPPQFGDTIIFLGLGKDSGSRVAVADLRHLLLKGSIRFYGLTFLPWNVYKPDAIEPFLPDPGLVSLSDATGCYFSVTNSIGFSWYQDISEPYRLRVVSSTAGEASLDITLLPGLKRKNLSDITIRYPQFISP